MIKNEVFFCDGKCLDDWKKLDFEGYDDHFCKAYRNDGIQIVDGKRVYCLAWNLITECLPTENETVIVSNGKQLDLGRFYLFSEKGKESPSWEFRTMTGHLMQGIKQWMPAPGHNVTGYLDE